MDNQDCYLEHFGPPDITRWHALPSRAAHPLYRFRDQLDPATYEGALERGRREASIECLARGIPVPHEAIQCWGSARWGGA
eukprot:161844-Amphidinium_carterae.1